ncbi:MAG: hypothetical protein QG669_96 [Patescibacteria group bacterium]|nr:hypothetical protein [Patescibacteria group bacterium]MDQ5961704.1 hypothetical protein [Patescibacteria group bacterium]
MKEIHESGKKPLKPRNIDIPKEPGRPLDHPAWETSVIKPGIAQYSENEETFQVSTLLLSEMALVKNLNSTIK